MFKVFLKITIIFLFFISFCYSEELEKIIVNGNKRISNETILVLGNLELNSNYDQNKLNLVLKELYSTNFFSDIALEFNNGVLEISVEENPIIENIEIIGIKNKNLRDEILSSISLKDRMSFSENIFKNDIILIQNILKSIGYFFSEIESSKSINKELNSVRLNINVNLGNKVKIKEITFIGDKQIKDKKLLEIIASEEHKFWKFISNKVYFNENLINLDKRLLENYYKNLGYYDVSVSDSFVEFKKDELKLTYNISSGKQFFFNNLNLTLPEDYNEDDFKDIKKIFENLKNERYSLDQINLILKKIENIASSRLYDFIDANVNEKIVDDNKLDFEFILNDSKKFYIERINIFGNFQTYEEVIRNKLIIDEGDPLNNLLYNNSINKIKSLGYFKNVNSVIKDGSTNNLKVIDISVEEMPTGEISLAAGIGTSGTVIGGGIREKNFLGKGININTNLEISEDSIKGQFVYSKPNFAYTDNTLNMSLRALSSDFLSSYGYKTSNTGFSLGTSFEQFENLFFTPEFFLNLEDLKTDTSASSQLKKQEGSYQDIYFNYDLTYDLRDASFRPTSGNVSNFSQELPLVSDTNEITNTFAFTQYKNLNKSSNMIGKASIYLKSVNTIDSSDVRISKRASIPYSRLRGFENGKIGPIDNNDYIGGNYVSSLNFSTNLPMILSTVENIDFNYFVDIANVWGVDYDNSIDDSFLFRSSTGLGIDLLTPVGPLTFSISQPITKKNTDKTETFRFNLGTSF